MFSIFAGVRNSRNIIPIASPKGLPKDISWVAKWEAEEDEADAHTHSWLTWKEIKTYDWDRHIEGNKLIDKLPVHYRALFKEMEFLAETFGSEGVRIVFWFDN